MELLLVCRVSVLKVQLQLVRRALVGTSITAIVLDEWWRKIALHTAHLTLPTIHCRLHSDNYTWHTLLCQVHRAELTEYTSIQYIPAADRWQSPPFSSVIGCKKLQNNLAVGPVIDTDCICIRMKGGIDGQIYPFVWRSSKGQSPRELLNAEGYI